MIPCSLNIQVYFWNYDLNYHNFLIIILFIFQQFQSQIPQTDKNGYSFCNETLHAWLVPHYGYKSPCSSSPLCAKLHYCMNNFCWALAFAGWGQSPGLSLDPWGYYLDSSYSSTCPARQKPAVTQPSMSNNAVPIGMSLAGLVDE